MNIRLTATILSLTLLVLASACGGGGGGGGTAAAPTPATMTPPTNMPGTDDPMTPPTNMPGTDDPMTPPTTMPTVMPESLTGYAITDLAAARTAVGGTAPTNITEAQIVSGIQTRATAADSFDFRNFSGASTVSLTRSSDGNSYSGTVPNVGELTFSLTGIADLSLVDDTNLVGFNSDTQLVMDDRGVTVIQSQAAARQDDGTQLSFQTYGGWLDDSVFGVQLLGVTEGSATTSRFASFSFGEVSGTRPTGSGTLTWSGIMVGSTNTGDVLQGDLHVAFDTLFAGKLDLIQFVNVKNLNTGNNIRFGGIPKADFTLIDLKTDGTFEKSTSQGNIKGSFHGTGHEGVSGIFNRGNVFEDAPGGVIHNRNTIIGAFGGVKDE